MFLTIHAVCGHAATSANGPFWKTKEKIYERVENGEIIVAVKSLPVKEAGKPKHLMTILGGGHVAAPALFVFKKALEFDQLGKVSGYIKSAKFDADSGKLDLVVGAFGFEGKMKLQMKIKPDSVPRQIDFVVIEGGMEGLAGTFTFSELDPRKTEVGIDSTFRYDKFPAPQVFLEFGLEVVFQRMAARLRGHVEEEYKKAGGAS